MTKKLIIATILIIVGEILSLTRVYFTEAISEVPSLITGMILVNSVILEIIGIVLLFICIAEYDKKK